MGSVGLESDPSSFCVDVPDTDIDRLKLDSSLVLEKLA